MRVLGRLRLSRSTEESTSIRRQREIVTQWAEANSQTVVGFAEDVDVSGSVDPFDTPQLGKWLNNRDPDFDVIASVIAFLAEGELETMKERQLGSRRKLRELGRWPGGKPPYGYTAVKTDDGWTLEVDPLASKVVQRIVNDVIDGKTIGRIAKDLTTD